MPPKPAFPVADPPPPSQVADWAEAAALSSRSAFKSGDLKTAIALESLSQPDIVEQAAWNELEARAALFGNIWPFRIQGKTLRRQRPSPVDLDLYRFLVYLSLGGAAQEDRTLFEVVITELIVHFGRLSSLHLGAPSSNGMDPSFRARVATYVAQSRMVEFEVKQAPLPHDQDLGVDAVTWIQFPDRRGGDLHFLAQCATGDDWKDKLHDLDLEIWKDHIHWGVTPVRLFAVPFVLNLPETKWIRTAREAGLVLDRPRLMAISSQTSLSQATRAAIRRRNPVLAAA